jgi:copper resistance protein B
MRSAACLPFLLAAAPGAAQRLPYEPVWDDAEPRLIVDRIDDDHALALAPAADSGEAGRRPKWLRYGLLDRFEWTAQKGRDGYAWDLSALIGGETNRLWLSSVGEGGAALDYLELQALYSRAVGGGWDVNGGLRYDARPRPQRVYATLGGQLERGELWLGAFAFLSHKGELSGRITGIYNWTLAEPLVLQPSFELGAEAGDIAELGLGRGLSYAEAGLRLRFELVSAFAPYVGLSWERSVGRTARMAREAGEEVEAGSLVLGIRSDF